MTDDSEKLLGLWRQLKGRVKEEWGRLSDDQLTEIEGRMERLVGHLQETYGLSREEAERAVSRWVRRQGEAQDGHE